MQRFRSDNRGFTIIELLVVIVILFILVALIALTASGVQAKNRNGDRQAKVDTIRGQLEGYYAQTNTYPSLGNLNDHAWRVKNLPHLKDDSLRDPRWNAQTTDCTVKGQVVLAGAPASNCLSYQPTSAEGVNCDNIKTACVHYSLTANLEGGEKYSKSSLN